MDGMVAKGHLEEMDARGNDWKNEDSINRNSPQAIRSGFIRKIRTAVCGYTQTITSSRIYRIANNIDVINNITTQTIISGFINRKCRTAICGYT
jgi:hypothetical protein